MLAFQLIPAPVAANSTGPPDGRTGAPGELTCDIGCHQGQPLNSEFGELVIVVPPSYTPDATYTIQVNLSQSGQSRWGFELTALDEGGFSVGSLTPRLDGETQVSFSSSFGREYIKHTLPGTAAGQPEGHAWSFEWTAPPDDVGPVTFYAAGNAANNNGNNSGDYIYTTSALVPLPEPGSTTLGATALALAAVLASRLRRR